MSPQLLHFYYRCQMPPQPATAARAQEARRQVGRLVRGRTPQALFSQSSLCMNPPYFLNSAYGINHPPAPPPAFPWGLAEFGAEIGLLQLQQNT